jgi:hypothetical protein
MRQRDWDDVRPDAPLQGSAADEGAPRRERPDQRGRQGAGPSFEPRDPGQHSQDQYGQGQYGQEQYGPDQYGGPGAGDGYPGREARGRPRSRDDYDRDGFGREDYRRGGPDGYGRREPGDRARGDSGGYDSRQDRGNGQRHAPPAPERSRTRADDRYGPADRHRAGQGRQADGGYRADYPSPDDDQLALLRAELRQYQKEALAAQRELAEARRRVLELETRASGRIGQLLQAAREQADEAVAEIKAEASATREAADRYAADTRAAADADAERTRAQAAREADQEIAVQRTSAEHEMAVQRATAEREAAAVRAAADREVKPLKTAAKREADELIAEARRKSEELRARVQRFLDESESLRSQAAAEWEVELAARREDSERRESEQMDAAQAASRKLVEEAERRAADAGKRAADAKAKAEQSLTEAGDQARLLTDRAREEAGEILEKAKAKARKALEAAELTADDRRGAIARELEELTAQRDGVKKHLAEMRAVFGA